MTRSRMCAVAMLMAGLVLAATGLLVLTSGEGGYLRLVGGLAAAGALWLLFFGAGLYFRKPALRGDTSGMPRGLVRRLILLTIGLYAIGVPLYAVLVSGQMPTLTLGDNRMISLRAEAQSFWLMAGLHAVPGLYCLFKALWQPR